MIEEDRIDTSIIQIIEFPNNTNKWIDKNVVWMIRANSYHVYIIPYGFLEINRYLKVVKKNFRDTMNIIH